MTTIADKDKGRDKDVRLMTLQEIEDEVARLDERRRLLMRVRKLLFELNGDGGRGMKDDHRE